MPDLSDARSINLDACIKCSACFALCPVAAVYPPFPGPKGLGPDAERFRLEGLVLASPALEYCSNCKTCEVTCPSGVRVTDFILRARGKGAAEGQDFAQRRKPVAGGVSQAEYSRRAERRLVRHRLAWRQRLRDYILGRAEYLGKLGTVWPALTNAVLRQHLMRRMLEGGLGISSLAPLPAYARRLRLTAKNNPPELGVAEQPAVLYFPGCFTVYNDAPTGEAVRRILEHNGFRVIVPDFHCCGVPLEANGYFRQAAENIRRNLELMKPYLQKGVPVVTSCTSCGLALKEEYPRAAGSDLPDLGSRVFDLFEFLWDMHQAGRLREDFVPVEKKIAYHAPCHLKAQGIGTPALRVLRLIPGVRTEELDAGCCGLSGSFGFKKEKYPLAMAIGRGLFARARTAAGLGWEIGSDCGGCRVQIAQGAGVAAVHPAWLLAKAYDLPIVKVTRSRDYSEN